MELEEFVGLSVSKLSIYKDYLEMLSTTGGRLEIYISSFCTSSVGMVFNSTLLSQLAELRMALELEIFPKLHADMPTDLPSHYFLNGVDDD